ncbi:MAG TPA: TM2 domain-containing protein [Chitinophagales bacterium]|nr:TM2 domain-containing protein [Chitinophagales bacterium]
MENPFLNLKSVTPAEMVNLKNLTANLSEDKLRNFVSVYSSKRREAEMILIISCVGLLGFAGIQRFLVGQIGMGLLYFFTGGLCLIGTILDIINHKELADEYNAQMANETLQLIQ